MFSIFRKGGVSGTFYTILECFHNNIKQCLVSTSFKIVLIWIQVRTGVSYCLLVTLEVWLKRIVLCVQKNQGPVSQQV